MNVEKDHTAGFKVLFSYNRSSMRTSLTVFQLTDLTVLLLEFLTDLLHWDVVAEWFGNLVDYLGGCVTCCPNVVTLDMWDKEKEM